MKKVTNSGGGRLKSGIFVVTSFLNGPLEMSKIMALTLSDGWGNQMKNEYHEPIERS